MLLQTDAAAIKYWRTLAELRQLEDRFLLNPYSRAQQRVTIETGDEPADADRALWLADVRRRLNS